MLPLPGSLFLFSLSRCGEFACSRRYRLLRAQAAVLCQGRSAVLFSNAILRFGSEGDNEARGNEDHLGREIDPQEQRDQRGE